VPDLSSIVIRHPPEFASTATHRDVDPADEIGKTAEMFEIQDGNKRALFISFLGGENPLKLYNLQ